jgi:hypothetical protein
MAASVNCGHSEGCGQGHAQLTFTLNVSIMFGYLGWVSGVGMRSAQVERTKGVEVHNNSQTNLSTEHGAEAFL